MVDLVFVLVFIKFDDVDSVFENCYVYVDWGVCFVLEYVDCYFKVLVFFLRMLMVRIVLDFILEKGGSVYLL